VLVGVLLGLSRMSGDAEITAMRAAGVSGRSVTYPVLTVCRLRHHHCRGCSLWLTPWAIRERFRVLNVLAAEQVTAEIQARVFDEQFPRKILYVGDVIPGPVVRWRNVFLADVTPPEDRPAAPASIPKAPASPSHRKPSPPPTSHATASSYP
jgi:lipopolysaccharide export LptBFGC system permease protein LptF